MRRTGCLLLCLLSLTAWGVDTRLTTNEVVRFREPREAAYRLETATNVTAGTAPQWIQAWPVNGSTNSLQLGAQVILQVETTNDLPRLLALSGLVLHATYPSNVFVLQASDARAAARAAARLAQESSVTISHPVRRRPMRLHGSFAPRPNDPLWGQQWHLEDRDTNTAEQLGFDLDARSAWATTRGAGVIVAQGDDGIELNHPDLQANTAGTPHHDFVNGTSSGYPLGSGSIHATAVAGLIAAQANNALGVSGVAPEARLASWVIFDASGYFTDEIQSGQMFGYASNIVSVQNHSWGNADVTHLAPGVLEVQGIANAVQQGRGGRGVVMVRAAGNEQAQMNDANDDGFANDPQAITVGAVRNTGRVTSYSTPGACVLVAAFSDDTGVDIGEGVITNYPTLATTDRQGSLGYNANTLGGYADYAYGGTGFGGTSGSTPQISGLCALILSANPALSYRDVQQVLMLSARQLDPADPNLRTNGAGFPLSHYTGFGVPDAGTAVALAKAWRKRPASEEVTASTQSSTAIPDDGLRVLITGTRVPTAIQSIPAYPADGLQVDDPTETVPLVDVGQALTPITQDLTGKAALIQRGQNYFATKLRYAAAAGAKFAIVYNNVGTTDRVYMGGGEILFSPIPAVFIDQTSGSALHDYLQTSADAQAQIKLNAAVFTLPVTDTLSCEHVSLRVRTSHQRRADLRICLVSPAGTRSVLQHFNSDTSSPLTDWTYTTVHSFYESSAGDWRVEVSDERPGVTGNVLALDLTVSGVRITDTDHDGLDDDWERTQFGNLAQGPRDDPDRDGLNNLREFLLGTNPSVSDRPLILELGRWDANYWRLTWPTTPYATYRLFAAPGVTGPYTFLNEFPPNFGNAEWLVPVDLSPDEFFRLESRDPP